MSFRYVFLPALFALPSLAWADSASTAAQNTLYSAQQMQKTVETASGVNPIQTNQTQTVDKWTEWGLTREDWTRYEELMKGTRGIWTPNLDPLTTLGVEARNEAERERYATLLAKKEFQRTENELKFQRTYNRVFERLYPNILPFSMNGAEKNQFSSIGSAMNRVIYFTRTDCNKKCADDLVRLFRFANNTPIDIYVVDSEKKDDKIRAWAIENGIDPNKVKTGQITLNHDNNGYWFKYAKSQAPAAFYIKGDGMWQSLVY